jgi:hypothetical protein
MLAQRSFLVNSPCLNNFFVITEAVRFSLTIDYPHNNRTNCHNETTLSPLNSTHIMDHNVQTRLEDLPPEILHSIMEHLLLVPTENLSLSRHSSFGRFLQYKINHTIDPSVLRVSKKLKDIGEEVLYHSNQWVVFDLNCAHLLLRSALACLPLIVLDPEDVHKLPRWMLHVRIRLYTEASLNEVTNSPDWPLSKPKHQIILVSRQHLPEFLNHVRIMELAYSARVAEGHQIGVAPTLSIPAKKGRHGLSICVHVNSAEYRQSTIAHVLELFRRFHGPLNELSINGFANKSYARDIEASISSPHTLKIYPILPEIIIHISSLLKIASSLMTNRKVAAAKALYYQTCAMIVNSSRFNSIPSNGWYTDNDDHLQAFEFLIVCVPWIDDGLAGLMNDSAESYRCARSTLRFYGGPNVDQMIEQDVVTPHLSACVTLMAGLHCIFEVYHFNRDQNGVVRYDLQRLRLGLNCIEAAYVRLSEDNHISSQKALFFRVAWKMMLVIDGLDIVPDPDTLLEVIRNFRRWFVAHLKPFKWKVHGSCIPQYLIDRGILKNMIKVSSMTAQEQSRYYIVDCLKGDFDATGEYYLV